MVTSGIAASWMYPCIPASSCLVRWSHPGLDGGVQPGNLGERSIRNRLLSVDAFPFLGLHRAGEDILDDLAVVAEIFLLSLSAKSKSSGCQ